MSDLPEPVERVRTIPIAAITILNPRVRNRRSFQELVTSIAHLGLKRPITVSKRPGKERYDLICGQGRMEAYVALGQTEIPAIVVEADEEECYVMSLVENLARRHRTPLELIRSIGSLRDRGHSVLDIARMTDFSTAYVYAICGLLERGEEKLISAVERGVIPHTIATEIASAEDGDVQRALAKAYEEKALPGNQVLAIRTIVEQRNTSGKAIHRALRERHTGKSVTSDALIRTFQRETERQRQLVKRANLARGRLIFLCQAMRRLLEDEHFVALARAEGLGTLPKPLVERMGSVS